MKNQPSPAQLRAARALLGLKQSELAALAKVAPVTLRFIEDGRTPGHDALPKIVRVLKRRGIRFDGNFVCLKP